MVRLTDIDITPTAHFRPESNDRARPSLFPFSKGTFGNKYGSKNLKLDKPQTHGSQFVSDYSEYYAVTTVHFIWIRVAVEYRARKTGEARNRTQDRKITRRGDKPRGAEVVGLQVCLWNSATSEDCDQHLLEPGLITSFVFHSTDSSKFKDVKTVLTIRRSDMT